MSESKYQTGFGVITSEQNPQTFMIPIYSTTVLYDTDVTIAVNSVNYVLSEGNSVMQHSLKTDGLS